MSWENLLEMGTYWLKIKKVGTSFGRNGKTLFIKTSIVHGYIMMTGYILWNILIFFSILHKPKEQQVDNIGITNIVMVASVIGIYNIYICNY